MLLLLPREVVVQNGTITTVAGAAVCPTLNTRTSAFSDDGGPATHAIIDAPQNLAFDGAGNPYVGSEEDLRVRRIDAATGIIRTVAGGGRPGSTPFAWSRSRVDPVGVTATYT